VVMGIGITLLALKAYDLDLPMICLVVPYNLFLKSKCSDSIHVSHSSVVR
jgi:hypothetical protein